MIVTLALAPSGSLQICLFCNTEQTAEKYNEVKWIIISQVSGSKDWKTLIKREPEWLRNTTVPTTDHSDGSFSIFPRLPFCSLPINLHYRCNVTPWQLITEIHELQDVPTCQSLISSKLKWGQKQKMTSFTTLSCSLTSTNCNATLTDTSQVYKCSTSNNCIRNLLLT